MDNNPWGIVSERLFIFVMNAVGKPEILVINRSLISKYKPIPSYITKHLYQKTIEKYCICIGEISPNYIQMIQQAAYNNRLMM